MSTTSRYSQERKPLTRSSSTPKLSMNNNFPEQKSSHVKHKRSTKLMKSAKLSEVPKLNLALDVTAQSEFEGSKPSRIEDEFSSEFLPVHNVSAFRPTIGNDTQHELVLSVPTLGDDTVAANDSNTFDMDKVTDFVKANMKISPKKLVPSGRSSVASNVSQMTAKHKAGSVPKYAIII